MSNEKITVPTDGGFEPVWSDDERRLFDRIGSRLIVVSIQSASVFRSGRLRELFEGPVFWPGRSRPSPQYDVSPNGEHSLIIEDGEEEGGNRMHLILNWFEELERLAPPD